MPHINGLVKNKSSITQKDEENRYQNKTSGLSQEKHVLGKVDGKKNKVI